MKEIITEMINEENNITVIEYENGKTIIRGDKDPKTNRPLMIVASKGFKASAKEINHRTVTKEQAIVIYQGIRESDALMEIKAIIAEI